MSTQPENQNQHSNPTLGFQTQDLSPHHCRLHFQSFVNGTANTAMAVRAAASHPAQAIPDYVAPIGGAWKRRMAAARAGNFPSLLRCSGLWTIICLFVQYLHCICDSVTHCTEGETSSHIFLRMLIQIPQLSQTGPILHHYHFTKIVPAPHQESSTTPSAPPLPCAPLHARPRLLAETVTSFRPGKPGCVLAVLRKWEAVKELQRHG
jgi:hypothetical protein